MQVVIINIVSRLRYEYLGIYTSHQALHIPLAVQQRGHLLAEILDNSIRATLDLQTLGDSVQLDVRVDRPGDAVDLLGLLFGPH